LRRGRPKALPFARGLAGLQLPNRVHFHCGCTGSFRCFPPRLAAARLLQVLSRSTVPAGRGLPPRRMALLRGARAPISRLASTQKRSQ
jgi:hypothetical protein